MKRAIIVQGAPGVGKTTIARRLGRDLDIRVVAKDSFKEMLYDTVGAPINTHESKLYGRIAIRAMYNALDEFIKAGTPVLIEAPLEPEYAVSDLLHYAPLDDLLQLYVFCDPSVQEQRFRDRVATGNRHSAHGDDEVNGEITQARNRAIDGIETISFDTTNTTDDDYERLKVYIRAKLKED